MNLGNAAWLTAMKAVSIVQDSAGKPDEINKRMEPLRHSNAKGLDLLAALGNVPEGDFLSIVEQGQPRMDPDFDEGLAGNEWVFGFVATRYGALVSTVIPFRIGVAVENGTPKLFAVIADRDIARALGA